MAKFQKGNAGKPKGAKNKLTTTVKEAVLIAFNEMQGDEKCNLLAWGKKNPTMFYQIASKLIPTEVSGTVKTVIKVNVKESGLDGSSGN